MISMSRDTNEASMESSLKADKMPWPALTFSKVAQHEESSALAGRGIPCPEFVDADGAFLSHSYEGERYIGSSKVMADIAKRLVTGSRPRVAGFAAPLAPWRPPRP